MSDSIEDSVLRLPAKERSELALKLLESLDTLDESEFDRLWGEESMRRLKTDSAAISGEAVALKARALLR